MIDFLTFLESLDLYKKQIDYYDEDSIKENYKNISDKISEIEKGYPFNKPLTPFVTEELDMVFLNLTNTLELSLLLEDYQTDMDQLIQEFKGLYIRRKNNIEKELEELDNKINIVENKLFELMLDDPKYKLLNEVLFTDNDEDYNKAEEFWDLYSKTHINLPHICDFSIDELKEKHKNVLELLKLGNYDYKIIGLLISAECYDNVWGSRSCSGHVSDLVGGKDYLDFYCGSSNYYWLCYLGLDKYPEFWKAMKKDGFKNLWERD